MAEAKLKKYFHIEVGQLGETLSDPENIRLLSSSTF